jgi:hypothetical protein
MGPIRDGILGIIKPEIFSVEVLLRESPTPFLIGEGLSWYSTANDL